MADEQGLSESKEVRKWADDAMFRSETHDASTGPKVHLLHMTADPLAAIAACAKMYKGEIVRSFADVTHAERREYLAEMQKTKLKMPLEAVSLHFQIENVTRAFTHQLVRQRTAAYAQESMRFAVVEDMTEAVALPPSLAHFNEMVVSPATGERVMHGDRVWREYGHLAAERVWQYPDSEEYDRLNDDIKDYLDWRLSVSVTSRSYNSMIARGRMPAEDARGIMPTNIVTRINYITNLRGLLDHAGNRLCTQAQFEWRLVFAQISQAIRNYGKHDSQLETWRRFPGNSDEVMVAGMEWLDEADSWQYEAIADLLQPVCYQIGRCAFEASFDRKCSIRERVQASAEVGRSDTQYWDRVWLNMPIVPKEERTESGGVERNPDGTVHSIAAIQPREWLADPGAAR